MAKIYDAVLVIDIESTCWQGPPPHGQLSEIIEIGICSVSLKTLERADKRAILIKPVHSRVSEFCTRLTSITTEDLANAGTLADAVSILKKHYRSLDRLWVSWGDYDRRQFERVCKELTVPYPFGKTHLNLKSLFAAIHGHDKEMGLDEALEFLGIPLEGRHHRGVDDAWNIAQIFVHVMKQTRGMLLAESPQLGE